MILKENDLLFAKTKELATVPTKRLEDGCYDLYAYPDTNYIIEPNSIALIPTGIATAFSTKYRLAIRERGSNTKSHLITMAGQVDSGYRGEIFVALYNGYDKKIIISQDYEEIVEYSGCLYVPISKAICQFAMEEVPIMNERTIDYNELKEIPSERGTGSLGSSNK